MVAVTHLTAERRSLALHREVARRLCEKPELVSSEVGSYSRAREVGAAAAMRPAGISSR
jgi:hypothetical protein